MLTMTELNSTDLAERAGASYRQIDYWTRAEILQPATHPTPGSGRRRHYRHHEVAVARLCALLVPWSGANGSALSIEAVKALCEYVRLGGRGEATIVPGVTADLDAICGPR
jgi:DNA-binding transcriptional MerR regulator